jgi:hypothetical protein
LGSDTAPSAVQLAVRPSKPATNNRQLTCLGTLTMTIEKAAPKQKTCENPACRKRFRPKTKRARFCNPKCRYKKAETKRLVDPMTKALKTAFFYFLARECIRARTLEILRGHTVESLSALYRVYTVNMFANGGGVEAYELSHIFPVNDDECLGLLRADNLVCVPKALNHAHGKRHFGYGKSVHRLTLDPKYTVGKKAKRSDVIPRIVDYLGVELVTATVKTCKIKPTYRSRLIEWIVSHYDLSNPVHKAALPDLSKLDDLKPRELQHIQAAMLGEEIGEYVASPPTRPEIILCRELTRISEYRPELEVYAYAFEDALTRTSSKQDKTTYISTSDFFTDHHAQMLFDVLHGKPLAVMKDTLEMVIAENTEHRYITYGYNPHGYRYHIDVIESVRNPSGGAELHKTTLAAFKASVVAQIAPHVDPTILVIPVTVVLNHDVYDPPHFA